MSMQDVQTVTNPEEPAGVEQYIFSLEAARVWISQCTRLRLGKDDFFHCLSDGIVLCRLMLRIYPRSVPKINEPEWLTEMLRPLSDPSLDDPSAPPPEEFASPRNYASPSVDELPLPKRVENIIFFLEACRDYGLPSSSLCSEQDILNHNGPQIVACLQDLSDLTKSKNWEGPFIASQPAKAPAPIKLSTDEEKKLRSQLRSSRIQSVRYRRSVSSMKVTGSIMGPSTSQLSSLSASQEVPQYCHSGIVLERMPRSLVAELVPNIIGIQSLWRMFAERKRYRKRIRDEAYRLNVANEIFDTEKRYISQLQVLVDLFLIPLLQHQEHVQIQHIYAEIEVILGYSRLLLEMLEPRVVNWDHRRCLADIFITLHAYLKVYTQYVKDYSLLMSQLQVATKEPEVKKLIRAAEKNKLCNKQCFEDFLILPVQRIPRYQLLLNELVKHTESHHPDYFNLCDAVEKIKGVGNYLNERKREFEALFRVLTIQNKLVGKFDTIAEPHRRFVREGKLTLVAKNEVHPVYLFNDLLLITDIDEKLEGERVRRSIDILQMLIEDVPDTPERKHCFKLHPVDHKKEDIVLQTKTGGEKKKWIEEYNRSCLQLQDTLSQIKTIKKKGSRSPSTSIVSSSPFSSSSSSSSPIVSATSSPAQEKKESVSSALSSNITWSQGSVPPELLKAIQEEVTKQEASKTRVYIDIGAVQTDSDQDIREDLVALVASAAGDPEKLLSIIKSQEDERKKIANAITTGHRSVAPVRKKVAPRTMAQDIFASQQAQGGPPSHVPLSASTPNISRARPLSDREVDVQDQLQRFKQLSGGTFIDFVQPSGTPVPFERQESGDMDPNRLQRAQILKSVGANANDRKNEKRLSDIRRSSNEYSDFDMSRFANLNSSDSSSRRDPSERQTSDQDDSSSQRRSPLTSSANLPPVPPRRQDATSAEPSPPSAPLGRSSPTRRRAPSANATMMTAVIRNPATPPPPARNPAPVVSPRSTSPVASGGPPAVSPRNPASLPPDPEVELLKSGPIPEKGSRRAAPVRARNSVSASNLDSSPSSPETSFSASSSSIPSASSTPITSPASPPRVAPRRPMPSAASSSPAPVPNNRSLPPSPAPAPAPAPVSSPSPSLAAGSSLPTPPPRRVPALAPTPAAPVSGGSISARSAAPLKHSTEFAEKGPDAPTPVARPASLARRSSLPVAPTSILKPAPAPPARRVPDS